MSHSRDDQSVRLYLGLGLKGSKVEGWSPQMPVLLHIYMLLLVLVGTIARELAGTPPHGLSMWPRPSCNMMTGFQREGLLEGEKPAEAMFFSSCSLGSLLPYHCPKEALVPTIFKE